MVVLPAPFEAHQHDHGGGLGREIELCGLTAHEICEFLVDDLDDHLGGGEALQHVGAHRALGHGGDELLDDLEVDVGLQQGNPDLAHGLLDVGLGEAAFAAQLLERRG